MGRISKGKIAKRASMANALKVQMEREQPAVDTEAQVDAEEAQDDEAAFFGFEATEENLMRLLSWKDNADSHLRTVYTGMYLRVMQNGFANLAKLCSFSLLHPSR